MAIRILVILTLILSGCALKQNTNGYSNESWTEHANQILKLNKWSLKGKIGARNGVEATSFNISWSQEGKNFSIRLFGPLGQGTVSINGDENHAVLTQGKVRQNAESLTELMQVNSNIELPLDYLNFWLRGIPAPGYKAGIRLDEDGLLSELIQDDWIINYSEYYFNEPGLPRKLNISKADISAKIIIKAWDISE